MRICLVCTEKLPLPPVRGGAIQTYIAGVVPYLSAHHAITVVCRTDLVLTDREEIDGVRYVRLPAGLVPEDYCRNVATYLATERFDLVVIFNRPAFVPLLVDAVGGTPLILSMHNDMFNFDRFPLETARSVLERVSAVVTISDYVRETIDRLHPGYAAKLRTIRSGVDLVRFRPWWRARARRQRVRRRMGLLGRQVVLHVSRLSPKKGNHLVLEAMEQVLQTHPRAVLLVVGSRWYGTNDPDDYTIALHLMALQLNDAVRFTGFVPPAEIPDLFLAGDVFVNASQWQEPLARVHYEAMAAGLPIVTTDRGGNVEVIEEGGNGLIARPHDHPAAFAAHIRRLLDDPPLRERLGRRGRALAEEHYAFRRVADELLEVFEACASS